MKFKAATDTISLRLGEKTFEITKVKGDDNLFRVVANKMFIGYLQNQDGELIKLSGNKISPDEYDEICKMLRI